MKNETTPFAANEQSWAREEIVVPPVAQVIPRASAAQSRIGATCESQTLPKTKIEFHDKRIGDRLAVLEEDEFDRLDFGVIGFGADGAVTLYNAYESRAAGLGRARVVGRGVFTEVAPCMNNFLVAHRFQDTRLGCRELDATIDYVLTLRMRPTPVQLRLVQQVGSVLSYILVQRRSDV